MKIKLAEALLRRKELQDKVAQLKQIQRDTLHQPKIQRRNISETVDEIFAEVPKVTVSQITAEYDFYAGQLRRIDAAIQQANWTVEVEAHSDALKSYPEAKLSEVEQTAGD